MRENLAGFADGWTFAFEEKKTDEAAACLLLFLLGISEESCFSNFFLNSKLRVNSC